LSIRVVQLTFLGVDTENCDDLVPADADELVDGPDAPPGEFGALDHALDVVVLEQRNVSADVRDLGDVDHDHLVHLGVLVAVEPAAQAVALLRGRRLRLLRSERVSFERGKARGGRRSLTWFSLCSTASDMAQLVRTLLTK
jgi:hypothetical protein